MRRLFALLAAAAGLTIAAAPALAADVTKVTVTGTGLRAISSNAQFDSEGRYVPGTYMESVLAAYHLVFSEGNDSVPYLEEEYATVAYRQFTIDGAGIETTDWTIDGGGPVDTLAVDRTLTSGRVVAAITANGCIAYDSTASCTTWGDVGTFEIDLSATGVGRLTNDESNPVGSDGAGLPSVFRNTNGGFAWTRAADLNGTVTLGGESVVVGGSWGTSQLSRGMGVQVLVFN